MRVIYKKKIYNGMVELRSYEVEKLLRLKEKVRIFVGDEYMDVTPTDLLKGRITNTQHSIINKGQTYKLVGFPWRGTTYKEVDAGMDIDLRLRLKEEFYKKFPEMRK